MPSRGYQFESGTDTVVIAQLIAYFYQGDLIKAIRQATELMKGFWGLAIIHKNHPDQIVAVCCENPVVIGMSKDKTEAFISSDPNVFKRKDIDLFFLNNHEIALVSKNSLQIFDHNSEEVAKQAENLELAHIEVSKGGFEHFMLKEIFDQPDAIQSALHNRFIMESGSASFEHFALSKEEIQRVLILGCGTSWHAGCIAALQFEEFAQLPASAEIASEFRYRQALVDSHTLVIALSQSGETFDTVAAVRKAKEKRAKVLAICNVASSTLMREADQSILLRAGPEVSVCSTKAFTCQLSILSLIALYFARQTSMTQFEGQIFLKELIRLPQIVESVLGQIEAIERVALKYATKPNFFFLGRQYMVPACLEAALKLKEISYLNAFGYPSGELKHGPIALIDPECLVVGLCGNRSTLEKTLSNLAEVKARKGNILAFAPEGAEGVVEIADDVIWLPHLPDPLAPVAYAVATQLLAYFIAKKRGKDIDQPRNLAKSVTVE